MPIYEYECQRCKEEFSVIQGIGAPFSETRCPRCGSDEIKKKLSVFSCSLSNASSDSLNTNKSYGRS